VSMLPFGDASRTSAAMMYVPIHSRGAVIGVLSVQSYTPGAYSEADLTLLQALAEHCGEALERIKLAAATRELAAIVEHSGDAICTKTLQGVILTWNKAAERLYGYTAEEAIGRPASMLMPPELRGDQTAIRERIARGSLGESYEATRLRKDGMRIDVSLNLSPTRDEDGQVTGISVIARDITDRKRLEREIAELSQHEQHRLANELHDHFGAYLAGVAFRAKALAEELGRQAAPGEAEAHQLVNLINVGTAQIRDFARVLSPVGLVGGGLSTGLVRLGAELQSSLCITCLVDVPPEPPPMTDDQALQLYRIAQEAARNAVSHGKAGIVRISLQCTEDLLRLRVQNNGESWSPAMIAAPGLGLRIMRYRTRILGGVLAFEPETGGGGAVVCEFPVSRLRSADGAQPPSPT
jgi:two-component system, LuxR family, sensor kinase FixL